MASKYLEWKYRNVTPEEPIVLTKKQRFFNRWHYYKWHVIIGAVLLVITVNLVIYALGIGREKPDYVFAYVGAAPLPSDTVKQLETNLAGFGEDKNSDGKVTVKINQYPANPNDTDADTAAYASASRVRLMGDLESRESCFFILDDVETFHKSYEILAQKDGSIAVRKEKPESYKWSSLSSLKTLSLGKYHEIIVGKEVTGDSDELLSGLYLARRGFSAEDKPQQIAFYNNFWKKLTKGE